MQSQYQLWQGQISDLHTEDIHVHYLKNIQQQKKMAGATAVAEAALGQASAVFSAQAATDEGDPVEGFIMQVDGKTVMGSFWKTTFKDGDEVQVIGEEVDGVFHAVALTLPQERMIWMQPHCERGTKAKQKSVLKGGGYFFIFMIFVAIVLCIFSDFPAWFLFVGQTINTLLLLFFTVGLSWKDFMAFAAEMDAVGNALGLPEPEKIDLFKTTKAAIAAGKPDLPMGVYYY